MKTITLIDQIARSRAARAFRLALLEQQRGAKDPLQALLREKVEDQREEIDPTRWEGQDRVEIGKRIREYADVLMANQAHA